jgi:hypothetical protein
MWVDVGGRAAEANGECHDESVCRCRNASKSQRTPTSLWAMSSSAAHCRDRRQSLLATDSRPATVTHLRRWMPPVATFWPTKMKLVEIHVEFTACELCLSRLHSRDDDAGISALAYIIDHVLRHSIIWHPCDCRSSKVSVQLAPPFHPPAHGPRRRVAAADQPRYHHTAMIDALVERCVTANDCWRM